MKSALDMAHRKWKMEDIGTEAWVDATAKVAHEAFSETVQNGLRAPEPPLKVIASVLREWCSLWDRFAEGVEVVIPLFPARAVIGTVLAPIREHADFLAGPKLKAVKKEAEI